jgi:hypothetical protein
VHARPVILLDLDPWHRREIAARGRGERFIDLRSDETSGRSDDVADDRRVVTGPGADRLSIMRARKLGAPLNNCRSASIATDASA